MHQVRQDELEVQADADGWQVCLSQQKICVEACAHETGTYERTLREPIGWVVIQIPPRSSC